MKNLELENFGVQEMNAEEMQNVDGGFLIFLFLLDWGEIAENEEKAAFYGKRTM